MQIIGLCLECNTAGVDYPVDNNIFAINMKHNCPTVVDNVHRLGVRVNGLDHCKRTFTISPSGIRECLYLTENTIDEIMATCRLEHASNVFGNTIKVTGSFIAHYHGVASHRPHPVFGGTDFRTRPATYSPQGWISLSDVLCGCVWHQVSSGLCMQLLFPFFCCFSICKDTTNFWINQN